MDAVPGLVRRPLEAADAPAVLALVVAQDREFSGEAMTELEDILAEWQVPAFDLARDSISLWQGDQLVASAELGPRGRLEVVVATGWREQGLADGLLDELEDRARHRRLPAVNQFVSGSDTAGLALLRQRGYQLHHTSWILRLDPDVPIAGRRLPEGYRVRPFREEDARAAFTVVSEAFGEWETGLRRSFADWEAETLRRPGLDLASSRVATVEEEVVGCCIVVDSAEEAWVSHLATARPHRGRGVAQQLLAEAYTAARQRGLPVGGLSTDTRTGALDLYLRLGMRVRHTFHNWSLDLTGAAAGADPSGLAPEGAHR